MITYLMDNYKNLRKTVDGKIYQREKLVDKIRFIIPKEYEGYDLSEFVTLIKYADQINNLHTEILVAESEIYKDEYITYTLPIDTKLTKYSGNIEFRLSFVKNDTENESQYVLHTSSAIISVLPIKDLYNFVADESLEYIDQKIAEIDAKIQAIELMANTYDSEKADDIEINEDKTQIQLLSNGEVIGNPITLSELHEATEETLGGESLTVIEL